MVAGELGCLLLPEPMVGITMKLSSPESGLGACCQSEQSQRETYPLSSRWHGR